MFLTRKIHVSMQPWTKTGMLSFISGTKTVLAAYFAWAGWTWSISHLTETVKEISLLPKFRELKWKVR